MSEIFELKDTELIEKITKSCQKNEIQFQCAYGFFNDLSKIRAYIELLKQVNKLYFKFELQNYVL